jgi:tRNA threonylcarbamoyladenosine biosynthesis protein TsaB
MGLAVPDPAAGVTVGRSAPQRGRPVVLACDTSTKVGSIALLEGGVLTAETLVLSEGSHSRRILDDVSRMLGERGLAPADIDLLVSSIGPGSFTGVRITLAAFKGLAVALDRPLVGVSALDALALPLGGRGTAVLAALDARKGEVYGALYAEDGRLLLEPRTAAPGAFARAAADLVPEGPVLGAGEGVSAWRAEFEGVLGRRLLPVAPFENHVRASVLAVLGAARAATPDDRSALEPTYLRRSEAEVKLAAGELGVPGRRPT